MFGSGPQPGEPPAQVKAVFDKIRQFLDDEAAQNELYPPEAQRLIVSGSSVDRIADATGEFGRDRRNPIPVNGFIGELLYISQLRTLAGCPMMGHRLGAIANVDVYELVSFDGARWDLLYFDMYHAGKSHHLPVGFHRAVCEFVFATNQKLAEFRKGIREAISQTTRGFLGVPLVSPRFSDKTAFGRFHRPAEHASAINALRLTMQ